MTTVFFCWMPKLLLCAQPWRVITSLCVWFGFLVKTEQLCHPPPFYSLSSSRLQDIIKKKRLQFHFWCEDLLNLCTRRAGGRKELLSVFAAWDDGLTCKTWRDVEPAGILSIKHRLWLRYQDVGESRVPWRSWKTSQNSPAIDFAQFICPWITSTPPSLWTRRGFYIKNHHYKQQVNK